MKKTVFFIASLLCAICAQAQQAFNIADYFTKVEKGGTYYLYNTGIGSFINADKNPATLTDAPTTSSTITIEDGSATGFQLANAIGGYVKIGFWGGQNVWTNGSKGNTDWVIEATDDDELLYTIKGTSYNEADAAGRTYYLYGTSSGMNADTFTEGKTNLEWAFVSLKGYEEYHYIIQRNKALVALKDIISEASELGLNTATAQAVLDNPDSTLDAITQATNDVQASIANMATLEHPKDVSALYMKNTDFELSLEGWTSTCSVKNNQLQTNATIGAEANEEGAFTGKFWENWAGWTFNGTMGTTAEALPTGIYQFSLSAFANKGVDAYVFANNDQVAVISKTGDRYHVMTYITDGKLQAGLQLTQASNSWVGVDNAELLFYGNSVAALKYWFEQITIDLRPVHHWLLDDLLYALADKVNAAADYEGTVAAIQQYKEMRDSIYASIKAYEAYNGLYTKASALASTTNIKAAQQLTTFLNDTYYDYLDGVTTTDDIAAQTIRMQELMDITNASIRAHEALNSSFLDLESAMGQLAETANEEALTQAAILYEEVLQHISLDDLSDEEIYALIQRNSEAIAAMRVPTGYEDASESNPFDMTRAITNDSFDNDDNAGWSGTSAGRAQKVQAAEMWNKNFDMYQHLAGLPNGRYVLSVQGFYRAGWATEDVLHQWKSGESELNAVLYAETSADSYSVPIMSVWDEIADEPIGVGSEILIGEHYTPNDMTAAVGYFDEGMYVNELPVVVTDGKLKIGIRKSVAVDADWTMFDNFKLIYYGDDGHTAVTDLRTANVSSNVYYTLDGVRHNKQQRGLNIMRGADGTFRTVIIR